MSRSRSSNLIYDYLAIGLVFFVTLAVNNFSQKIYYQRFEKIESSISLWLSLVFFLIIYEFFRENIETIGNWLSRHLLIFYFLPALVVTTSLSNSILLITSLWVSLLLFCIFYKYAPVIKTLPNIAGAKGRLITFTFAVLVILITLTIYPPRIDYLSGFNKDTVISLRIMQRQSELGVIYSYLYPLVTKFSLPFIVAYSIYKKNYLLFSLAFVATVLVFMTGGHRSVIGVVLFTIMIAFLVTRTTKYFNYFMIVGLLFFAIIFFSDSELLSYLKMLIRRIFLLPAYFPMVYADTFGLLGGLDHKNNTSGLTNSFYVGYIIHGEVGARANAGSLASFIPSYGFIGPIIGAIFLSFFVKQFSSKAFLLSSAITRRLYYPMVPSILWILIDTNFLTALLSQSLIFIYIVLRIHQE